MELAYDELSAQIKRITLAGRLDLKGAGEIEQRFTTLAGNAAGDVIIDLKEVEFIASIGMRLLLTCAKAKARQGGRMALYGLRPIVKEALEMAGIDSLVPMFADEAAALAGLSA